MPLSEHEQRMLDQIERELYAEDPKFANTVRETNPAVHYKRWILKASIGFVVGVALLMGGVIAQQILIGVAGFIVMLACTLWGMSGYRRVASGGAAASAAPKTQRRQRPGVMERFEERWRRRQEGDQ
ncbi:DUF3040 domain-containing protein [Halostreptopolyspora alba]|uniref:DUF3040 domain-containing protein n=1 Tax=Halostreptopolyspora alba TaxID=2487137 RepID=A0A3N0EEZ3_9ACTN|nr:DUF3040 domain-containing protein [Nocardiopsaceae bacterium YIM 96095]